MLTETFYIVLVLSRHSVSFCFVQSVSSWFRPLSLCRPVSLPSFCIILVFGPFVLDSSCQSVSSWPYLLRLYRPGYVPSFCVVLISYLDSVQYCFRPLSCLCVVGLDLRTVSLCRPGFTVVSSQFRIVSLCNPVNLSRPVILSHPGFFHSVCVVLNSACLCRPRFVPSICVWICPVIRPVSIVVPVSQRQSVFLVFSYSQSVVVRVSFRHSVSSCFVQPVTFYQLCVVLVMYPVCVVLFPFRQYVSSLFPKFVSSWIRPVILYRPGSVPLVCLVLFSSTQLSLPVRLGLRTISPCRLVSVVPSWFRAVSLYRPVSLGRPGSLPTFCVKYRFVQSLSELSLFRPINMCRPRFVLLICFFLDLFILSVCVFLVPPVIRCHPGFVQNASSLFRLINLCRPGFVHSVSLLRLSLIPSTCKSQLVIHIVPIGPILLNF